MKAKWTVMIYMAGHNNLDSAALDDIRTKESQPGGCSSLSRGYARRAPPPGRSWGASCSA